jgi:hypothetical protein
MTQPPIDAVVPIRIEVGGMAVGDGEGDGDGGGGDAAGLDVADAPAGPVVAPAAAGVAVLCGIAIDGISPQPAMSITDKSSQRTAFSTNCAPVV